VSHPKLGEWLSQRTGTLSGGGQKMVAKVRLWPIHREEAGRFFSGVVAQYDA
jgi:hypothetical protein